MIALPDGFDYNSLVADYIGCLVPFVPIFLAFAVYRVIKRLGGAL